MPKEIYNEGRVVGLSAWEIFCRNVLEKDPTATVPSERTWLASSIGSGASLILRIPAGAVGVKTFELPTNSTLSAAGVIVASPFIGNCAWSNNWATKVVSYGGLIQNDSDASPTAESVPSKNSFVDSDADKESITEYLKIQDGIVYQQGTWIDTGNEPEKDLKSPDFKKYNCSVRLYIAKPLSREVKILLTGFTDKWVLSGISGMDMGSTNMDYNEWENGGMLGPAVFPWASKIVFTMPSAAYTLAKSYKRTLPSDATLNKTHIGQFDFSDIGSEINSTAVVDMTSADPLDYYEIMSGQSNCIQQSSANVTLGVSDSYASLITWYPGMSASRINSLSDTDTKYIFPPALYGIKVNSNGERLAAPIDVAAPGTVKAFNSAERTLAYVKQMPDNFAIYHDESADGYYIVDKNASSDVNTWKAMSSKVAVTKDGNCYVLSTTAGSSTRTSLALCDTNGNRLPLNGTSGTLTVGPNVNGVTWGNLTDALSSNRTIDILGANLRSFASKLPNVTVAGNAAIKFDNATITQTNSSVSNTKKEISFSVAPKSGTNYIVFNNGLRLYISKTAPTDTDVPVGSIGIGW